ncbi:MULTISPECIES: respiratory nitrate reductase subunit gamma [Oceanospirillaceae]|jgi:nitrate reductase gamma subunit|uniref:nitrate reductase (quinone) n=1 Tax=Thalassolituus pacificus TaxID=2975440 RepID=A0A9X2WEX4_9GAMM|nr:MULTISPECIES: respiratory nitrate reductase subunit gamma [Thalassolituus]MAY14362.1 respiratory nitrate reductase subunit gamma [Oceanospirillaceae bacterium]MBU2040214.1 respiratory nitrate reductase subunit gamma [Gammaproteobacteria bacterium]PIQ41685.1 MAG: respiratory nitrate reductase subunit gamma [Thalassolituus sp. CG17_big_fil_post_rev_8_21_14_2_50_53_8]MCA6058671.1 respiratory nitrate reductase subunit gamma [Thalassolituus sp. ST750PaO-4]MCB2386804.1 respiratory nitrate reducta
MSYFNTLAFGVYPYVAMAILFIGSWIRYDREQYSWKASSSQLLEKEKLRMGSILFHVGVLGIFFGHLFGLLTPVEIWHAIGVTAPMKQLVAMGAGGLFGLICFIGLTILIQRRLFNPRIRATSKKMDIVILFLLYAQLILGLISIGVSAGHLDGHEMMKLMMWAQNIMTLDLVDAVENISSVHWIFKMHIMLGMTLFVVFPFSRLVHMLSAPVQYVTRQHQIVRKRFAR